LIKVRHSYAIDLDEILVTLHLTPDALDVPPPRILADMKKEKLRRQNELLVCTRVFQYFIIYI
jgi:hypothetical protein